MTVGINEREAVATAPEDVFIELFAQVFGLEKVQMLGKWRKIGENGDALHIALVSHQLRNKS